MLRRLFERWYGARLRELERELAKLEEKLPGKRLTHVELELAELRELHQTLLDSHKRLRSRTGMRELRARENGEDPVLSQTELLAQLERKHGLRK